jgi:hypothetical protein
LTLQSAKLSEDRIQSYLDKVAQSITDTKNSVHNENDVHFTPSHSEQPCLRGNRMKSSSGPLTANTVEPICPASPLPYLDKVAQSIIDTKNSVHSETDVHITPSYGVQPCLTGNRMSSSSPLTPNTVEPIYPESSQPYLNKVAHSITDTKNSVHNEKNVHFTPRHSVKSCLTGSIMKSSVSLLTPNTVELRCPASHVPDPPRKFFKFRPVWKSKTSATVTVNKNIKLVSFCNYKYTGQLNLMSKYETCPIVICNMDCKVSSFFPRIITRLHQCYQLLQVFKYVHSREGVIEVVTMFYFFFMFFSSNNCFKLLL